MRLLQINALLGYNSTGVIMRDIHEAAVRKGIDSFVAYSKSNYKDKKGYKIGNAFDRKIHAMLCRIRGRQAYFSIIPTLMLMHFINKTKPQVIHLHNLHSNYINLNMLLKFIAEKDIALVLTLHDCWFFTGKCFHYSQIGCTKWQSTCGNCPKPKLDTSCLWGDSTTKVLEDKKQLLSNIRRLTVVGVSEWIANEAAKSFLKERDITYIYNGVDTQIFKPQESDFRDSHDLSGKFVILGMASKWLTKQNELALAAVSTLVSDNIAFVLVGCNKKSKVPDGVIALPHISDTEEMAKVYSMADVFVNVTWEDSLPFVNIEAQSCGTPVITYNSCGATETISNDTGIVVGQGDVQELLLAIRTVMEHGKNTYSTYCRERALILFNKSDAYERYFDVYKNTIEGIGDLRN